MNVRIVSSPYPQEVPIESLKPGDKFKSYKGIRTKTTLPNWLTVKPGYSNNLCVEENGTLNGIASGVMVTPTATFLTPRVSDLPPGTVFQAKDGFYPGVLYMVIRGDKVIRLNEEMGYTAFSTIRLHSGLLDVRVIRVIGTLEVVP